MKKIFYFAALLIGTTFVACEKDSAGGTATESMAGQWYVTIDAVGEDDEPIDGGEDYFGSGQTIFLTYNTSANNSNEMWLDDLGEWNVAKGYADYWESYGYFPTYTIKAKVNINQQALTFSSTEAENFGEGYEWWTEEVKLDENGDTVWTDTTKTEPEMVDVMFHAEKAMPVTVEGKILKGAGRQNNGSPADSIVFYVTYKDDPWYPADGYKRYRVSGIRYSGLVEND